MAPNSYRPVLIADNKIPFTEIVLAVNTDYNTTSWFSTNVRCIEIILPIEIIAFIADTLW